MQSIVLPGTNLTLSRVAFGTASIHHLGRAAMRERLIRTAIEHGITHFDTSPYYGNGLGEMSLRALGSTGTVATKVGLYPPGGAHGSRSRMLLRKAWGKLLPPLSRPIVDFSVARARLSLDDSLRRLRRERVDLLLLHEPRLELVLTDEWQRWIDGERERVRCVGVAGEPARVWPFVQAGNPIAGIIQTRDSVDGNEAGILRSAGRPPQITYGHLGRAAERRPIVEILRGAMTAAPQTVLLVSTRAPERIVELARGADAASPRPSVEPT